MAKSLPALVLAVLVLPAGATDVVTVTLGPDPRINEHISSIEGPKRTTDVVITRASSSETKRLLVEVHGSILDEDVQALVQSALARDSGFWRGGGSWHVSVTGDAKYAAVEVSMYCGTLCGGGETYTYGRSEGRWTYLYISDQWIS